MLRRLGLNLGLALLSVGCTFALAEAVFSAAQSPQPHPGVLFQAETPVRRV